MSIVPEILIQRAIINGFGAIRKDPRIIHALFKNLPLNQQEAIKKYVTESPIDFSVNYPRTEIKVPAIILVLKNERESQNFLFDVMGAPPNYQMPDQDIHMDVLGGTAASTSTLGGLPPLLVGGIGILRTEADLRLIVPDGPSQERINEAFYGQSSVPPLNLHVVSGTGAGTVHRICSITSRCIEVLVPLAEPLDTTSVVDIRYAEHAELAYGNPVRVYDKQPNQLRLGANYESTYQIEVMAGNQEEVIYLYTVLKAILFSQRTFFEAQGIMSARISGTDFTPRNEFTPEDVYVRSMTFSFIYPFSFLVEQEAFKKLNIVLTNTKPNDGEPDPFGESLVLRIDL